MSRRHVLIEGSLASLFARLEELVLANSGEDGFEEIFKLLLAKLWDQRGGGGKFRAHATPRATAAAIAGLLGEVTRHWPGLLAAGDGSRLAPDHLTTCVELLARVELQEAGGEALDATFEFLTARAAKGAKGQFFTPRHVVDFCVRALAPRLEETVADPACGSGAFLVHTLQQLRAGGATPARLARFARERLWGFDFDPRAVRIARALLLVSGGDPARIARVNSLLPELEDALGGAAGGGFDVILTNPPFAGEICEPALLARYTLGSGRRRVERDVLFVERCVRLLKPGGRLAIILPHNKFGAAGHAGLRRWLLDELRVVAVIGLGRNTFQPHTGQKACVLFGQRRTRRGAVAGERIFFGLSERDGKDAQGRPRLHRGATGWRGVDHDLEQLQAHLTAFRAAEALPWAS